MNKKIAIVSSKFNPEITEALLRSSLKELDKLSYSDIDVYKVPGAVEIPFMLNRLAGQKKYTGFIALGAVIKGETSHFDYVCKMVQEGILAVTLKFDIPIIFGILTTPNIAEAVERAAENKKNKGAEFARALIDILKNTQ